MARKLNSLNHYVGLAILFVALAGCQSTNNLGRLAYPLDKLDYGDNAQDRTLERQQLDGLIEKIVSILEVGQPEADFNQWSSSDIDAQYNLLRLVPSESPYGKPTSKKYIVRNDDFGTYFHVNFAVSDMKFFLPRSCVASTKKIRTRRILPRGLEGRLYNRSYNGSVPLYKLSKEKIFELSKKYSRPFYLLPCRNGVKIRMYSSELDRQSNKNYVPDLKNDFWTGVSIYYPKPNFKEIIYSPQAGVEDW